MRILLIFIIATCNLMCCAQCVSTSPINGSGYHNPETTIIIRFEEDVPRGLEFKITGSITGDVTFNSMISITAPVLILKPDSCFEYGETVVVVQTNPMGYDNRSIATTFQIRNQPAPVFEIEKESYDLTDRAGGGMAAFSIDVNTAPTNLPIFFKNSGSVGNKYWGIVDNLGTPINTFPANGEGSDFKINESGYLTMFLDLPPAWLVMDSSFVVIDTVRTGNGYTTDNHEIIHLQNGNSIVMAYDWQVIDMSVIVAGGNPAASVKGTIIQEVDANDNVVFEWRTWDHFQITDGNVDMTAASISYSHGNSIERDANGNLLASFRNMDEVTYINGTTGNVIWRLGGQNNMFTIINDATGFVRQHDARWIPNSNLTLYDNGETHPTPLAAAKEYQIDTIAWTAELVWRFDHPLGVASQRTGNVQRLSNGNTFINWGKRDDVSWPNWTEVDDMNNVVYEFRFTDGSGFNTYRAHRYEWDLSTSIDENITTTFTGYPNPVTDSYSIIVPESGAGIVEFFDINGRLLLAINLTEGINHISTANLDAGLYFVTITAGSVTSTRKVIKQ